MITYNINKVKGYRNMLGLTQTQIADKLNITKQSYSRKEIGKAKFTDQEKIKLKEIFRFINPTITIDDIFFK
ncbi:helix-turn-helix domain-containing protein [Eremococcus coleocola]|uniref:helix-turn-helix domain-containing protein n=1 Tax=Eremococcus coleocola TaxID=88132 RepID=UPI0004019651